MGGILLGGRGVEKGGQGGTDLSAAAFLGFCLFFPVASKKQKQNCALKFPNLS